jgi:plastocyanin
MKFLCLSFAGLLCAASLFAGATVEGTVGSVAVLNTPASGERYQIKASGVAKPEPISAVVYLEGDFPKAAQPGKIEVAQKQFQFAPGVVVVQKGTLIEFPNHDDDFHNVFSYSKTKRFDLGRYRKDEKPPAQLFDKAGVVKLFCEIHEHMRGTILVVDTPHFVKADPATGKFALTNLPAGKHTLKMWLDDKVVERPVELKDGETLTVDFK